MKYALTFLALLSPCHLLCAQPAKTQSEAAKPNFRELVAGLASPNRPIRCDNQENTISIPPNYDWKAQERIEANRKFLYDHCEEALPFLVEGCTDKRYSLVSRYSEDDDYYAWSVGRVCSEIISRHVEVFRDSMQFDIPRWHKYEFIPIPSDLSEKERGRIRDWWQDHKNMSLRDLQLAGFDWALKKVNRELKKAKSDEIRKKRSDEIKSLRSARAKLKRRHRPLADGVMWKSLLSLPKDFKVVPWTEEKSN